MNKSYPIPKIYVHEIERYLGTVKLWIRIILFYLSKAWYNEEFLHIDKNISFVNDMALRRFA